VFSVGGLYVREKDLRPMPPEVRVEVGADGGVRIIIGGQDNALADVVDIAPVGELPPEADHTEVAPVVIDVPSLAMPVRQKATSRRPSDEAFRILSDEEVD
jgi:hypothetical protein